MADAIATALRADPGSVLAFLPGAAEIRRTQNLLAERIHDAAIEIVPLFGALDAAVQDRAIAPAPKGRRKVVLATSIAETSLTIEGVRIVVDCGLARVPRYEPDIGLTRLETVRVSRAAADQRRGRAGRTEPGVCYRLWDEPQTASLEAYAQPEILSADLSSLVLDLAQWGVSDPAMLAFLDPPPAPALKEARSLLRELGALDADGRITAEGQQPARAGAAAAAGAHDRGFASAGRRRRTAAEIAAVLTERGLGGDSVDLDVRLDQFRRDRSPRAGSARAWRSAGPRRWLRRGRDRTACRERPRPATPAASRGRGCHQRRRHAGARLSRPRGAQPRQRQFRARQRPRRRGRSGLGAGARALYRGRRTDRHRGAGPHPAGGADHAGRDRGALCRPDRDRRRDFVRSQRDGVAGAAQARPCTRSRCRKRRWR